MNDAERYLIISEIGRGAMGVVYLAHDTFMDREVALKVLSLAPGLKERDRDELVARFMREAQAAGRLSGHANIVTTHDVGEQGDMYFIAMELVDGEPLTDVIERGALPFTQVIDIMLQLCDAMDYAHSRGIIHRDLKPENIFLLPDGRIKVADFGIARVLSKGTVTEVGTIIGTPGYMSPEQVKGQEVRPATDVFAAGVILFELLAGVNPYEYGLENPSYTSVIYQVVHEDPVLITDIDPEIPREFDLIISRAIQKDPAHRYASFRQLLNDLTLMSRMFPDHEYHTKRPLISAEFLADQSADTGSKGHRLTLKRKPEPVPPEVFVEATYGTASLAEGVAPLDEVGETSEMLENGSVAASSAPDDSEPVAGATVVTRQEPSPPVDHTLSENGVPFNVGAQIAGVSPEEEDALSGMKLMTKGTGGAVPDSLDVEQEQLDVFDTAGTADPVSVPRRRFITKKKIYAAAAIVVLGIAVTLSLVFTLGPSTPSAQAKVPGVVDMQEKDAKKKLESAGFKCTCEYEPNANKRGKVLKQSPSDGAEVKKGAQITLIVGAKEIKDVPNVTGIPQDQAVAALSDFTYKIAQEAVKEPQYHAIVLGQTPPQGSKVDAGSEVSLVVGVYTEPPPEARKQCPTCGGGGNVTRSEDYLFWAACGSCGGSGQIIYTTPSGDQYAEPCGACGGAGGHNETKTRQVSVTCGTCGGRGWVQ